MKADNIAGHRWNEDLDDVFNVLGLENYGNIHIPSYPADNAVIALKERRQQSPAIQPTFDEDLNFFQDPSTFQMSSCRQWKAQNWHEEKMQSTATPEIKVQSAGSVFPVNQHLEVSQSGDAIVVPSPTVTDSIQPNSTNYTFQMGCAVFGKETSLFVGKSSKEIHAKLQAQNHGNSSPETKSRMQSSSKLFGILSLILQAFDCPLTTELEDRYVCALQKALVEIQNARFYLQKSQEQ